MLNNLLRLSARPGYTLSRVIDTLTEPKEVSWEAMGTSTQTSLPFVSGQPLPRIAMVKQVVYQDLYCCPPHSSVQETIFSSLQRTGPVALFTKLNADFFIVDVEPDPECNIWKEKCSDCNQNIPAHYEALITKPYRNGERGHKHAQGEFSVRAEEIDWGAYDIVIGFDVPVPARITRLFPQVVWCYCLSEPCMGSYSRSRKAPVLGYDLFLNQRYRCLPPGTHLAPHEIEFPYFLQYYGCFRDLYGSDFVPPVPEGMMLESHSAAELTSEQMQQLEEIGTIRSAKGSVESVIMSLMSSKYFVRLGGRKLWGNAMVEAVAAGCLAIGNPNEYKNKCLFTVDTEADNFSQVLNKIKLFDSDPALYEKEVEEQRKRLNYLCYDRPLSDLNRAANWVRENRSNNSE
ncbi:MAG: hypothetical protein ACRYFS_06675 [Janthinobacterium lividum]